MRKKYKLDRDTRTLLLKYIRKYEQYTAWLKEERARILLPSPKENDGMPRGSGVSDTTGRAIIALEKLDNSHRAQVVRAIDEARTRIGFELVSEKQRKELERAIWKSCLDPRKYPFEVFAGFIAYERRQFYYCKNKFLNDIKNELGI